MIRIYNEIKKQTENGYIKNDWFNDEIKNLLYKDTEKKIIKCIAKSLKPKAANLEEKVKLIFKPFSLFPMSETKLILMGQAPYPDSEQLKGLAFLFDTNNMKTDDLLGNISIVSTLYNNDKVFNVWDKNVEKCAADNKILLLNSILTYENEQTLQLHKDAWDLFTKKILSVLINSKGSPSTFLWVKNGNNILFQKLM
ncbi:MAG: hypothetical protein K6C94_07955 [Candidatus Gastranaerophilales bacterium]|nr:hypothetical protein [Candidatus Gastranaerophilales bacterium]